MSKESLVLSFTSKADIRSSTTQLTGSKSESNRALIIAALGGDKVTINNLSNAHDTLTLQKALYEISSAASDSRRLTVDIGPAGTAMRFLTVYLTLIEGEFILTGTKRMQERPIGTLVDALQKLGADINYIDKEGFPPLKIKGGRAFNRNEAYVKGNISSQYLSALMLCASSFPDGLTLHIEGELTSKPYFFMTLNMLTESGIHHEWKDDATVVIKPQKAKQVTLSIEPDWSAASYWYSIVALSPIGSTLSLPGLRANSLQGDSIISTIMSHFGVASAFSNGDLHIERVAYQSKEDMFDFKPCPDLAQSVIVCAAALGISASFTGLETLRIKETDRIKALQDELKKFNATFTETSKGVYYLDSSNFDYTKKVTIKTYEDHRMAMAFAPLALVLEQIEIEEPAVVDKSYPEFWEHLQQYGFAIN